MTDSPRPPAGLEAALRDRRPADFAAATWQDVAPLYAALAAWPLSRENVEEWLRAWSRVEELLSEAASLAMIGYTQDTTDPYKEEAHLRFSGAIVPRIEEQSVGLAKRLLELGYVRPGLEMMVARFRTQSEIFREANVPLLAAMEEHSARYQRITGTITVNWEGEERTLPQLLPVLKSPRRGTREQAFRVASDAYVTRREVLADVFDRLFDLRTQVAANAGFANFEDYAFRAKFRFDYTAADCARFHAAVEEVVVPAVERVHDRRRRRLGLGRLRPWDLGTDPERRPALTPFREMEELAGRAEQVFAQVSSDFGSEFRTLRQEQLLDLGTRKGKAPGGYCETLSHRGRPFIFMNAVGVADDVATLLHEAGHAFHAFGSRRQPLIWQRHPGLEMCELASMSMELLAAPYLGAESGGFFDATDLARARVEHFEDILISLCHIASVDAFQSWIYTSGEGRNAEARDRAWLKIRARFERGVDWSGLDQQRIARWYRQLHIFLYPFYYIEYGIAQLGALQVWRNSLADPADAVRRYREALALGATRSLPELYAAAGAALTFDVNAIGELVDLVEEHLDVWQSEAVAPAP